ncbi:MAG: hypothetical protein HZB19_09505 [Chloroflexi bacterium]|nr:hypothetical protein [Chloroflexota bacterium]
MKLAKGLKITALVLMGVAAAFFTFMGIGEMFGGDWSGVGHLPPVIIIVFLMWLGWKRPLAGGITMILLGVTSGTYFYSIMIRSEDRSTGALTMGGPFLLFGLIFLIAAFLERSRESKKI